MGLTCSHSTLTSFLMVILVRVSDLQPTSCSHTFASVTKWYYLVLAKDGEAL